MGAVKLLFFCFFFHILLAWSPVITVFLPVSVHLPCPDTSSGQPNLQQHPPNEGTSIPLSPYLSYLNLSSPKSLGHPLGLFLGTNTPHVGPRFGATLSVSPPQTRRSPQQQSTAGHYTQNDPFLAKLQGRAPKQHKHQHGALLRGQ